MASPASSKKQIIESIKDKKNILVTVSNNPSVDELSAALGLTIFLNKLDKHATAIASGEIPSALDFLDPGKTFEATADSLRDFIIALDKEKADHLRYKLDGDVVKIFITPYRTTITKKDLEFSQGDYNVEMVIALNVASRDELDKALSAHGKILHDAVVATVTTGTTKSNIGTIDWHEDSTSGVSEMVTEIAQELKTAKADIDEQISTAFLTGIVASTERFSNDLTSSKVMTMSAELMASGANQQLIAAQLQGSTTDDPKDIQSVEADDEKEIVESPEEQSDPTKLTISRDEETKSEHEPEPSKESADGTMSISHELEGTIEEVADQVRQESQEDATRTAEAQLNEIVSESPVQPAPADSIETVVAPPSITDELEQATAELQSGPLVGKSVVPDETSSPLVGGTLNATTAAAAEQKREDLKNDQNRTILTHSSSPLGGQPTIVNETPLNAAMASAVDEPTVTDIFAAPLAGPGDSAVEIKSNLALDPLTQPVEPPVPIVSTMPTLNPLSDPAQDALAAVNAVIDNSPAPMTLPTIPTAPAVGGLPTLADIEAGSAAGLPPMPDFSSLPPLPSAPTGIDMGGLPSLPTAPPPAQEFNPSQFQIPPQD